MYKSPEAIRSTSELWFRVELGEADEVPRKVIVSGCIYSYESLPRARGEVDYLGLSPIYVH